VSLMDNSCSVRVSGDCNRGWQPNSPTSAAASNCVYTPDAWEPPTPTGIPENIPYGYYRWTRGFNVGVDYRGTEINTGQLP
ncbi:MAG: hypothetical protein ACKVU4_09230, partial [Phycisphaerales bacterium]